MARPARPWHRKQTGWWMVEINGAQNKLIEGPKDEKHRLLAEEKFAELRRLHRISPQSSTSRTADIIEAFLAWSRQHLTQDTHRVNQYYGQLFAEHCGTVPARDLRPFHVTRWITTMMDPRRVKKQMEQRQLEIEAGNIEKRYQGRPPKVWGEATAHNARVAAFRVFSWAKEEGVLSENPLAGMKRPKPAPRQRAMSDDEFTKLHENAGGPFADYLMALRETGARPKELRDLLWTQVQEDRLILTKHKTDRKVKKARVIILTEAMKQLIERQRTNGHTHVFLNTEGEPWTMNAVRLQITRLRERLGLAKDLCAYLCRHGFGTRAIMNGVNPLVVAELMGHNSMEMISKVYVHLADEHAHLKSAIEQINPVSTLSPIVSDSTRKRAKPVNPKKAGPKPKVQQSARTP
jgi:integrase